MTTDTQAQTDAAGSPPCVVVTFESIGRRGDVPPITIESTDPSIIAERVYRHASAFLASRGFDVTAELHDDLTGNVWIEGGRFGRGTIDPALPSALNDPELHAERYSPDRLAVEHDRG